jgi:hypothetical protein
MANRVPVRHPFASTAMRKLPRVMVRRHRRLPQMTSLSNSRLRRSCPNLACHRPALRRLANLGLAPPGLPAADISISIHATSEADDLERIHLRVNNLDLAASNLFGQ